MTETKAIFLICNFIFAILTFALELYVLKTKLELLEGYFVDNEMAKGDRRWWGGKSFKQRSMRLVFFGFLFVFSKLYIWRGLVKQSEIDAVPRSLRLWVVAPAIGQFFFLLGLIIA